MKEANTRSKSKKNMEDVKAPIAARVAQDQLLIKAVKDQLNNSETSMKSTLHNNGGAKDTPSARSPSSSRKGSHDEVSRFRYPRHVRHHSTHLFVVLRR